MLINNLISLFSKLDIYMQGFSIRCQTIYKYNELQFAIKVISL